MIKYKVGDKIKLIDDDTSGVIIDIQGNEIIIENEYGFEERYLPNEILPDIALEDEIIEVEEEETLEKPKFTHKKLKKKPILKKDKQKQQEADFEKMVNDNFVKNGAEFREKLEQKYKKEIKVSKKRKGTYVLDLHYGKLENYSAQLPTQHILKRQIKAAISGIEKARNEGYAKIILVHGKGKGVLEEEVKKYLDIEGYTYYDADFRQYRLGATEVEL